MPMKSSELAQFLTDLGHEEWIPEREFVGGVGEVMAEEDGWKLDLFSTFLSRKHSFHRMVGKKRYVKTNKPFPANCTVYHPVKGTQLVSFFNEFV